jgi:hypothetical protein
MQRNLGILGALGMVIVLVWAVGWLMLGYHDGLYHALLPVGVLLILIQAVRRVDAD